MNTEVKNVNQYRILTFLIGFNQYKVDKSYVFQPVLRTFGIPGIFLLFYDVLNL